MYIKKEHLHLLEESWIHKVIREALESGKSIGWINEKYHIRFSKIINEIENDVNLKKFYI